MEVADFDADEAEGWMPNGSGHATNLAIFSFDELEFEPRGGNGFAEADGRIARRGLGIGFD